MDPDFAQPDFAGSMNVERYLAACPPAATTRGTFFTHIRDHVRRNLEQDPELLYKGVQRRQWHAFNLYPLIDFMQLTVNACQLMHPRLPVGEALRRMGWLSFSSFTATMSGRVVAFALGNRFEDVLRAGPAAYRFTLPSSIVRISAVAEKHFRIEMRCVPSFVDTYHFGVIEGAATALGQSVTIKVRRGARLSDADFDIRWGAV
jgi:uncharacterized protein (TIGR02265 family)